MRLTLDTLPAELITMLFYDHDAEELLSVNRRLYNIILEERRTVLYSPKTASNRSEMTEQVVHDYYDFLSRLNRDSVYTKSVETFYLNLEHFTSHQRLADCSNLADLISFFPNLQKLELTLHRLKDEFDDVERLIGTSPSCTDVAINIEYIDDASVDRLAQAILRARIRISKCSASTGQGSFESQA